MLSSTFEMCDTEAFTLWFSLRSRSFDTWIKLFIHSLTHSLTHPPTHSLTLSLTDELC